MLNLSPVIMNNHAKGHLLTSGDHFFQGQPRSLTAVLITVWIENFLIYFQVQFSLRWYLYAWESPYANNPIPQKFPRSCL